MKIFSFVLVILICFNLVMAKHVPPPMSARKRSITATKITQNNFKIDGILSEEIWNNGEWTSGLFQQKPNDGEPESFKTEFCILYDQDFIYVAARAHDPEPEKISAILSRRDNYTESDWMYISFDSFNDNRTAFEFGLNAAGVQHDLRRYDDENADDSWDAIWDGDAHIGDNSWTAEWRIPFKELRFTTSDNMKWGVELYRELPRKNNELSVWSYWAQDEAGFVSNYGTLHGLKNIQSSKPIYIKPYIVSQSNISDNLVTPVHDNSYDFLYNIGGDFRYSSPSGITLNATINPDFGQIEADPANFNLTEFETYFAEKRPFFMEGGNILHFPLNFGDGDNGTNTLFYSRRIGRAPQGWTQYNDEKIDIAEERSASTNILGATKITGKTKNGLSIGVMEALTTEEKATVFYDDGSKEKCVIEPISNYFLGRIQQDFNDGQATIGGIFTAVNRKLDGTGIDYLHDAAYTGGIDFEYEFLDRKYGIETSLSFSNVSGDTIAIQRTQKSSSRYFNRVDADHLNYDTDLTSLSGYSFKSVVMKNTGHFRGAIGLTGSSPGFEVNDMGYIRNVDDVSQFIWIQYQEWEPGKIFRQYRININQFTSHTFNGEKKNPGININSHFTFNNNWRLSFGINRNFSGLSPSMNRGGPALYIPNSSAIWTLVGTDQRKNLSALIMGFVFDNDDNVKSIGLEPSITWRPRQNLQLTADISYNFLDDTWAWIGSTEDNNGNDQYFWASMKQKTISFTLRADFTLTNKLSFQYYAQPYFTAGEYFDYKRVNDADNANFDKRFEMMNDRMNYNKNDGEFNIDYNNDGQTDYSFSGQTDFNYKQFRSNFVLRWEYSTGSVAYLVWSQGYTNYQSFLPFNFGNDINKLFSGVSDNVFMIKVSQSLSL